MTNTDKSTAIETGLRPAEADPKNTNPSKTGLRKTQQNSARRLVAAALPAAIVTGALVMGMNALISVDEIDLDETAQRDLVAITPMEVSDPAARQPRVKPVPIDTAQTPPPPPRYQVGKGDIKLAAPVIQGAVPKDLDLGKFQTMVIGNVAIDERNAQPIRPPILSYPTAMAKKGIQGTCEVRFDVSVDGWPFNIEPNCTHSGFEREARRAVGKVQFTPKVQRGLRVERKNVVYPLEFRMDDL